MAIPSRRVHRTVAKGTDLEAPALGTPKPMTCNSLLLHRTLESGSDRRREASRSRISVIDSGPFSRFSFGPIPRGLFSQLRAHFSIRMELPGPVFDSAGQIKFTAGEHQSGRMIVNIYLLGSMITMIARCRSPASSVTPSSCARRRGTVARPAHGSTGVARPVHRATQAPARQGRSPPPDTCATG